jgi:hypothetical protein
MLCVADGLKLVHPFGKHIIFSDNVGANIPEKPIQANCSGIVPGALRTPPFFLRCQHGLERFALLWSDAVGVTSANPKTFSQVAISDVGCAVHSPLRIVPHRGQVSENNSKSP